MEGLAVPEEEIQDLLLNLGGHEMDQLFFFDKALIQQDLWQKLVSQLTVGENGFQLLKGDCGLDKPGRRECFGVDFSRIDILAERGRRMIYMTR